MESEYRMTVARLTETLKLELSNGQYPRGTKFPSEYELAERFGINKTTANRAVTQLVNLGLLERGVRGDRVIVDGRNVGVEGGVEPLHVLAIVGNRQSRAEIHLVQGIRLFDQVLQHRAHGVRIICGGAGRENEA